MRREIPGPNTKTEGFLMSLTMIDDEQHRLARSSMSRRDPRQIVQPTPRDLRVLHRIVTAQWLAQYQAHILEFDGLSETVVSRSLKRLRDPGFVIAYRFGRGTNLLRATDAGASYLIERGLATESEVFVPRRRFDPRQLAHHLSVVDAFVALHRLSPRSTIVTCWQLRRRFASTTVPIPDLLVANPSTLGVVAVEIDRGTESLGGPRGLVEKLERLTSSKEIWAESRTRATLVLTIGRKRIESLRSRLQTANLPVSVLELPTEVGRPAIGEMERLFRGS